MGAITVGVDPILSNPDLQPVILPKILAVDDRPENLHSLARILSGLEAELITVSSGQAALSQILRHEFALILLDVMMPEMDGFETASLIRSHEASRHIPIIFVTAADKDLDYEGRGYDLGAVDYLFKPLQPHMLLSKVQVFLEQARQQQQLVKSLQEIRQLRDNNELLLRSVGEGILSLGLTGHISFANPAAVRLLGVTPEQLVGALLTDFWLLAEDDQVDEHGLPDSLFQRCRDGGAGACDEHEFRHALGHQFPVEYTVSPLHDLDGRFCGLVLVFQDISERKEREALELASKYKSAFLANISHELRTPLHSLLILAKKLAANGEGNLNADQVRAASVIRREGQDLLRLINDILDLSKVEAGKMAMHWESVQVADMSRHLESQFAPLAAEKNLALHLTLDSGLPDSLHTDRQRLQQILKNLLSNAVKFTHEGTVYLDVRLVGEAAPDTIAFAVSDTGIGIAAGKQAAIFESFQQVDVAINRHYEGTGLGLAICRELTRLLGGRITVQSEPEQGSCFTLYLPLQPSSDHRVLDALVQPPRLPAATAAAHEAPQQPVVANQPIELSPELAKLAPGKTLLLVDSDMRNSFTLASLFRRHGFNVIKAENCATAQARLSMESCIDVIIMGLIAPANETQQFFAEVGEHHRRQVFAMSLLLDPQMQQQAESCLPDGSYECLVKPVDANLLLTRLTARLAERAEGCHPMQETTP